ncbi:hypothetical protein WDZ92_01200 [Nostoc sp. NIES-2111]
MITEEINSLVKQDPKKGKTTAAAKGKNENAGAKASTSKKPAAAKEKTAPKESAEVKTAAPQHKEGSQAATAPDIQETAAHTAQPSSQALARKVDSLKGEIESLQSNVLTHEREQPWYDSPYVGITGVGLGVAALFALVFIWSILVRLVERMDKRKSEAQEMEGRLALLEKPGGGQAFSQTQPSTTGLLHRIERLEQELDYLRAKANPRAGAPGVRMPEPVKTSSPAQAPIPSEPVLLYAELGQDHPNKAHFSAGAKGPYTRIRLKELRPNQFQFDLDPELSSGQLDEVLTKPKQLEPFADYDLKPNPRRAETRRPGLAQRLPSGLFEVTQKALIEFIS